MLQYPLPTNGQQDTHVCLEPPCKEKKTQQQCDFNLKYDSLRQKYLAVTFSAACQILSRGLLLASPLNNHERIDKYTSDKMHETRLCSWWPCMLYLGVTLLVPHLLGAKKTPPMGHINKVFGLWFLVSKK